MTRCPARPTRTPLRHGPRPAAAVAPAPGRRAFTLIELLVVLALIVLALAAAVPAFSYITGSRSTDSAQNMIGAMVQRARSVAIQNRRMTGVAFFLNPRDQRATMALVTTSTVGSGISEDIYRNYRGWTKLSYQQNTASGSGLIVGGPPYADGQEVVALYLRDNGTGNYPTPSDQYQQANRPFTRVNSNISPPNDVNNTNNPAPLTSGPPQSESSPVPWQAADGSSGTVEVNVLDFMSEGEFETLPAGVAVQTINDPKGITTHEHYLQTGVILFDAEGRMISVPYAFQRGSQIYNLLVANPGAANAPALLPTSIKADGSDVYYSQLGVVLYDRATFLNQPNFTEGDPAYQSPTYTDVMRIPGPNAAGLESKEEDWLDKNTTPLFVNRGNGALMKGQ